MVSGERAQMRSGAARPSFNRQIADKLLQAADVLAQQAASPFRVGAYRRAADAVAALERDVRDLYEQEGLAGLEGISGVGRSIASAIAQMIRTGRWPYLEQLRGGTDPELLFCTIPGIGPKLAREIHKTLGLETLEALEAAAEEGKLASVPGMGKRRIEVVRSGLGRMLARARPLRPASREAPPIDMLLDVDREYRSKAQAGELRTIAPKRFNPKGEAWLPILHAERGKWQFTAMYSNTALAHELGRTRDWVVIYFSSDHGAESQCTVVTETRGHLAGERVVRGREQECLDHYHAA
jgi:hypothetical protein